MTPRAALACWVVFVLPGTALAGPLAELTPPSAGEAVLPAAAPAVPPSAAAILPPAAAVSPNVAIPQLPAAAATTAAATTARAASPKAAALPVQAAASLALQAPAVAFDGAVPTARQTARQAVSRAQLTAQRAATLPAHLWPFTRLAARLSHGEALAGLSPQSAVAAARRIRSEDGAGTVIGRLSWELHDRWSVRGAVRSYGRLIDAAGRAKAADPAQDIAVSLDVEALGGQLDGLTLTERTAVAKANALTLARRARDRGIPVEFDIGTSALLPLLLDVSKAVVRELGMPARLALAARYLAGEQVLDDWAALARQTGLRLGVRLVKGSFIEADHPGTLYRRRPLLDQFKRLITRALSHGNALDVAVATQNEEIWRHATRESRRLATPFTVQTIRGVNPELQARMRREGPAPREYVSYGVDTPVMALMEMWTNWKQRRALRKRGVSDID